MENNIPCNRNPEKNRGSHSVCRSPELQTKVIKRDKGGHCILVSIQRLSGIPRFTILNKVVTVGPIESLMHKQCLEKRE